MDTLELFDDIVKKVQNTPSRNEKEALLHQISDNDAIKNIFKFIYNPYILTGLSKKKIDKTVNKTINFDPYIKDTLEDVLNYLTINNTGKDDDILKVQYFIKNNEKYTSLLKNIFTKDLKIGITATTLNKVFGDYFIPTFDVMLANKYFDNPDKLLPDGELFILTEKLDGVRCVLINEDKPKFFSRQGQLIEGLIELENEVKNLPKGMVFDGELLVNSGYFGNQDRYRQTVSLVNSNNQEKVDISFHCFDMLPISDFKEGRCDFSAIARKTSIHTILEASPYMPHFVEVPMIYYGTDKNEILNKLEEITSNDGEGVMINIANAPYECKRSNNLLKVKKFNTADVRIVRVNEGTGMNKGSLGSLTVEFIAPDEKIYTCDVGSGFSYLHRNSIWRDKDKIIGEIIEIGYFEISQNKNGEYSLRFPTFKYFRPDKDTISMY